MPETPLAELGYKEHLKLDLFPTIWCPGCGIGTIMMQLAMVLDEMGYDETNTVVVTGIGCTGRMGGYMKYESVYTLHGRTLPVAEAIKTVRPELNVIVVAGDGDTASIGGNHLIHAIRRNVPVTVLCNNNEIYGLTGGQTGPTTPTGTKTLSSPVGNPNTPINLQGIVRSSEHALYAKSTVYHQLHLRNAIREALEWDGFSFVDITSQCIENNGRRIGFGSAEEMLEFYRKTYKRAAKGAERLNPFEIGILYPASHPSNGNGASAQTDVAAPQAPAAAVVAKPPPAAPAPAPPAKAAAPPAKGAPTDDEKARRRAESQQRAQLMAQLPAEVKLRVASKEITLVQALTDAGLEIPDWLRGDGGTPVIAHPAPTAPASPPPAPPPSAPSPPAAPAAPPAKPSSTASASTDPREAKRAEAQRRLALMQRLPSELKLRVAQRELTLEDALREAGIDPAGLG